MKGNNEISLNAATVMEALQEYFDSRSRLGVAVFVVKSVHCSSDPNFRIEVVVDERKEDKTGKLEEGA